MLTFLLTLKRPASTLSARRAKEEIDETREYVDGAVAAGVASVGGGHGGQHESHHDDPITASVLGEIGGGVCEVKVYTACQTQSGEPDADKRKLKATRGMGDDDEPEPFPIPAPGVGKQQLFESGIPTDSIVTRHFAIGECAQRVSEAYHRNSIQYRGTKPLTDSVLNEYPVWVVKGRAYNLGTPRSVRGHYNAPQGAPSCSEPSSL